MRDPLAHEDTDKVRFFKGDWRSARPKNFGKERPQAGESDLTAEEIRQLWHKYEWNREEDEPS